MNENIHILEKKRVLFLGVEFYNYHNKIKESIEELGAIVDFYPIIRYNFFNSILNNLNQSKHKRFIVKIGNEILRSTSTKEYDFVFVIQGWQQCVDFYINLKKQQVKAKFIMYHWDSLMAHDYLPYVRYFDRIFSYDPIDVKNNSNLHYLPLFYIKEHEASLTNRKMYKYDILFIGKLRSFMERYYYVNQLIEYSRNNNLYIYIHLYTDYQFYFKQIFKGRILRNVKFKPLSEESVVKLISKSKVIIDFHDPIKNGLTMRTFEALGANKKLLTTNVNILNESFFNDKIINIIDINKFNIQQDFVNSEIPKELHNIMSDYSIDSWAMKVFTL